MYNKENMEVILKLCIKLFGKGFENSNEFTTFVGGNPHLLRFKVEEEVIAVNELIDDRGFRVFGANEEELYEKNNSVLESLKIRRDQLKDLDRLIMEYIENNS